MSKLLGNKIVYLLILIFPGCKTRLELPSDKEREGYRNCTHPEVPLILADFQGFWSVESIDSTEKYNVLYLYSEAENRRVIGVSERANCARNKVEIGQEYYFRFSCDISSKGNHSLYILKPDKMFVGHEFMYRVPLGSQEDYINISAQNGEYVFKVRNMEGLCYLE